MINYQQEKNKRDVCSKTFAVIDIAELSEMLNATIIPRELPKYDPPFVGVTCEVFFVKEAPCEEKREAELQK